MRTIKHILAAIPLCAACAAAATQTNPPLWRADFTDPATAFWKPSLSWRASEGGRAARSHAINFSEVSFRGFSNLTSRVRFSCDVREFARDPRRPGHWGFSFHDADGNNFHMHCAGEGMIVWITAPDGRKLASPLGSGAKAAPDRAADNPRWTRLEFDFAPNGVIGRLGGATCFQLARGFLPVRGGSLFYNVDGEMRDVRFDALPPPEKGPVFDELSGGFMCWARYLPGREVVRFVDSGDRMKGVLTVSGDGYIRFLWQAEGAKPVEFRRRMGHEWTRAGDSIHLAFSWYANGTARLYLNGLPYAPDMRAGESSKGLMLGNEMAKVEKVVPGRQNDAKTQEPEELSVVRRSLDNREVYEAYRKRMPIDLQMLGPKAIAGVRSPVVVTAVPGGTFLHPRPFAACGLSTATVDVKLAVDRILPRENGGRQRFEPVPEASAELSGVSVSGETPLCTAPVSLAKGRYRLVATVSHPGARPYVRTLFFEADAPAALPQGGETRDEWTLGRTVWEKTYAKPGDAQFSEGVCRAGALGGTPFLEAGGVGGLGANRFGDVVAFAPDILGKPLLITFTWPDDTARAMGFVMQPEAIKAKREIFNRDRLQGGIFAGDAYGNTGKMQESSFLFYPFKTNYVLECRTQIDGRPAALAKVAIREIVGRWPRLKVREPEGLPARRFGYQDEDQTFFNNLNADFHRSSPDRISEETLRYLSYTGQNAFMYAVARYWCTLGAKEGSDGQDLWPYGTCSEAQAVRDFAKAGVDWIGEVYMGRTPEEQFAHLIDSAGAREGWFTVDRAGNGGLHGNRVCSNIACPGMNEAYLDNFMENVGRLARAGMKGVRHTFGHDSWGGSYGAWPSLEWGYDDWTVGRFLDQSAGRCPGLDAAKLRAASPRERYEALTSTNSPSVRAAWLAWRAARVTDFVKLYRRRLDAVAPGLPLTLSLPRARSIAQLYEEKGIDLEAIAGVPGVALGVSRSPTGHLWKLYRRQETKGDAELYDLGNPLYAEIRRLSGGAVDMVCEHNTYFETFRNSICPDRFNTYFQSLDVKPWGRNFLKTLVYDVALFDAKTITIGDQPIGTLGNEREAREFAQAFRALPALPFKEVFSEDGVVCRARGTKNGIYLYLVNLKGEEVTVSAEKASSPVFRQLVEAGPVDLSTGRKLQGRGIMLLPYQLRSFLVARGFSR